MPSIPDSWPYWSVELERYDRRRGRWITRRGRVRAPNRRGARNRARLVYSPWGWEPRGVPKREREAA